MFHQTMPKSGLLINISIRKKKQLLSMVFFYERLMGYQRYSKKKESVTTKKKGNDVTKKHVTCFVLEALSSFSHHWIRRPHVQKTLVPIEFVQSLYFLICFTVSTLCFIFSFSFVNYFVSYLLKWNDLVVYFHPLQLT